MLKTILGSVAAAAFGVVIATVDVGAHRAYGYSGAALGVLMVAVASIFVRAWLRWLGMIFYAAGWAVMAFVYSQTGPGDSLLVMDDAHGALFAYGGAAAIVLTALVPRVWLEGRHVET